MNKKSFAMTTIVIAVLALLCILVLMGLAAIIIPPTASNFFTSMGESVNDFAKRFLGIDFGLKEEEEEIELSALPEEYQIAFKGIYETFEAGVGDEMKDVKNCLIEYPKMPNLKKNAIAFEEEGGDLKILFIDDQGKRLQIKDFSPINGLTPCFVAGKTNDGEIVAKNFYENWLRPPKGGGGFGGGPEDIIGDVKMFNQGEADVPDTLQVIGNSEVPKGTMYQTQYNPTFLYKFDDNHICFMPEFHGIIPRLERDCRGEEQGLAYACFEVIRERVGCCGKPSDKGTCELEIEEDGIPPETSKEIDEYLQGKGAPWAGQGQCMVDASERTGVPVILMMALPVQEGGWSGSQLQKGYCPSSCIGASGEFINPQNKRAYNLFSIKGDGCWWRTWEVVGGETIHTCASFRAYSNYCDSINDFARIVSTSDRYSEAMQHKGDPEEMVKEMLIAGWATDPNWADSVINIIRTINSKMG